MYFQMKYNSGTNEYIISKLDLKGIDRSKMNDDVLKYSANLWVCKSKKRLILFAEEEKKKKIAENMGMIERLKNRAITVVTRGELYGEGKGIWKKS